VICEESNISVAGCPQLDWQINLRMMRPAEVEEWDKLQSLLSEVVIGTKEDEIKWGLSPSKSFTTSSLYKFLTS
jgi:hypothetical protein